MAKYKCEFQECPLFDKEVKAFNARIVIKNGKAVDPNDYCPECGSPRKLIRAPGMTTHIAGTNDQKNRMLR